MKMQDGIPQKPFHFLSKNWKNFALRNICGIILEASKLRMHVTDWALIEKCRSGFLQKGCILFAL